MYQQRVHQELIFPVCVSLKQPKSQRQLLGLHGMKTHDFEDNSLSFQSLRNGLTAEITDAALDSQSRNSVLYWLEHAKMS